MSTWKKPPGWAMVLMDVLEASKSPHWETTGVQDPRSEILRKIPWVYHGGTFGVIPEKFKQDLPLKKETCGLKVPDGSNEAYSRAMEDAGRRDEYPAELNLILTRRAKARPRPLDEVGVKTIAALYRDVTALNPSGLVETGMPAVYAVTAAMLNHSATTRKTAHVRNAAERRMVTIKELTAATGNCTLNDVFTAMGAAERLHGILEKNGIEAARHLAMKIENVSAHLNSSYAGDPKLARSVDFGDDDISWYQRAYLPTRKIGGCTWKFYGRNVTVTCGRKIWVLSQADATKVHMLVRGHANYCKGLVLDGIEADNQGGTRNLVEAIRGCKRVHVAIVAGSTLPRGSELDYAEAWKKGLAVAKARRCDELAAGAVEELMTELRACPIPAKHLRLVTNAITESVKVEINLGLGMMRFYRLLPPPDVSHAEALLERSWKACYVREVSAEKAANMRRYIVAAVLRAHFASPEPRLGKRAAVAHENVPWWQAYLERDADHPAVDDLDLDRVLAWEGSGTFETPSELDPSVYRDSGCAEDTFREMMLPRRRRTKKNMLLRLLLDPSCPTPPKPGRVMSCHCDTLLKPESAKKRIAYSACLPVRMRQSTCEKNVENIMKHHPCFAIGKTGPERAEMFDAFLRLPKQVPGDPQDDNIVFYMSTDVKGWSENMTRTVQKVCHGVFDSYYNVTKFAETFSFMDGSIVGMNAAGCAYWYTNGSTNFEGYNGKEVTVINIAASMRSIELARERMAADPLLVDLDPATVSCGLMSYIDDAATRVVCPRKHARRVFEIIRDATADAWAEFGMTIDKAKCFPSDRYFEFLGESGYEGRIVCSGSKAMMRILAESVDQDTDISERVGKIVSGIRGAVTSGMSIATAHHALVQLVIDEMEAWVPAAKGAAAAAWAILPASMGGLGVPTIVQIPMNMSGAAVEEGMAALWAWGLINAAAKKCYLAVLRETRPRRSPFGVLSAPMSMTTGRNTCVGGSVSRLVRRVLPKFLRGKPTNEVVKTFLSYEARESTHELADALFHGGESILIGEQTVNTVYKCLPHKIYVSFISRFEKRSTLTMISSRKAFVKMTRVARREAAAAFRDVARMAGVADSLENPMALVDLDLA